jgi:hypothetical protein
LPAVDHLSVVVRDRTLHDVPIDLCYLSSFFADNLPAAMGEAMPYLHTDAAARQDLDEEAMEAMRKAGGQSYEPPEGFG